MKKMGDASSKGKAESAPSGWNRVTDLPKIGGPLAPEAFKLSTYKMESFWMQNSIWSKWIDLVASNIPNWTIPVPHGLKAVGCPGFATYESPLNGGLIYSKYQFVVLMKVVQNISGLKY